MTDEAIAGEETGFGRVGRWIGLILGPALAIGLQLIPPPEGLSPEAWRVVSLAALMVVWWVTEAIPISATALIPLAALPLIGATSMKDAASPYADPIVFLFIGGFILAACVERWRLHERIALSIASVAGGRPVALVGGFMIYNTMSFLVMQRQSLFARLRALGVTRAALARLIIGEALVLGMLGGVLGILFGLGLSYLATQSLVLPFSVSPTVVVGAFAFSAAVGVFFGYLPARKAARLNPIEALRHE